MRYLLFLLTLCVSAAAQAGSQAESNVRCFGTSSVVLDDVALNGAEGTRTFTLALNKNYAKVAVNVYYTYGAATAVTLDCSRSLNGTTRYGKLTSREVADGSSTSLSLGTLKVLTDKYTTNGASQDFSADYAVEGVASFKCVVTGSGTPTSSDLVDVEACAAVGR